jgi:YlmC/YmxH family sporulation protein
MIELSLCHSQLIVPSEGLSAYNGTERGANGLLTKTSELREREVVNVIDGRRLGLASDLEIEIETGRIKAIVVPGSGKFLKMFGKSEEFVIPWEWIKRIGVDVILVEAKNYVDEHNSFITVNPG